jgi:hypothetical protein
MEMPAESSTTRVLRGGWRELVIVFLGFGASTLALMHQVAFHLGTVARIDNGDGQFSIWNVAWVARTLVVDPLHVFDANIFYPHRWTLAYSEANLGEGALAVPVYWLTRNAYAAHNTVLLLSFVLSGTATYYLVRYLAGDRRAAAIAAIGFAYCPFVFGHTPHIQLEWTAGLPLALLAFHRLADRPTIGRGAVLGAVVGAQALFCAYYAVFAVLIVGYAALVLAATRRLWTDARYWTALFAAAIATALVGAPLYFPYALLRNQTGFSRTLTDAGSFSATWSMYFASGAYAHAWMLRLVRYRGEVLFPGFVTSVFGILGAVVVWFDRRSRFRETAILYSTLGVLAYWASLGPTAGLYSVLYALIPPFTWLRAPNRLGLIVTLALAALAGIGMSAALQRISRPIVLTVVLAGIALAELAVPIRFPTVPPVESAYRVLATLPWGPVIEMPVYSEKFGFVRARYMLSSTVHWMPLVDAYSDYIPRDFNAKAGVLGDFPTREAFKVLEPDKVRYAVFHTDTYSSDTRRDLMTRLQEFSPYLRQHYADERTSVYEIIAFPP